MSDEMRRFRGVYMEPEWDECPICGPKGHDTHEDDSYGNCTICREWVPHTDDEVNPVAWPCAHAQLIEIRQVLAEILERDAPHSGNCCTFDADGKVIVTSDSCVCLPLHKRARSLASERFDFR